MTLWAGEVNAEAYLVAVILMLPLTFSLIQASGTQVLWAMGRHQVQAMLKIFVALLNVGLTIALVSWSPLIGAALGTAIACILGDIVAMNIVFRKYIGLNMGKYYKDLLRGIAPSIVVASVVGILVKQAFCVTWLSFFAVACVIVAVYFCCLLIFGFNDYEKQLFFSIFAKMKNSKANF